MDILDVDDFHVEDDDDILAQIDIEEVVSRRGACQFFFVFVGAIDSIFNV